MKRFFTGDNHNTIRKAARNICMAAMIQLLLYLLQYILLPIIIFPSPMNATLNDLILLFTTGIVSLVGMYMLVDKFIYWVITIPMYYLLVKAYCPTGLYGINYHHPQFGYLASREVPLVTGFILVCELCAWIIVKIINSFIAKRTTKV